MKINCLNLIVLIVVVCCFLSFKVDKSMIEVKKMNWFHQLRSVNNDTTYVLNFWATWCIPCVSELPAFDSLQLKYKHSNVKVILVSLDWVKKLETQLYPFQQKKHIQSKIVLLDEPDYNAWIEKVNLHWSGSLPATLIFNNHKHYEHFQEKETSFTELDSIISETIIFK